MPIEQCAGDAFAFAVRSDGDDVHLSHPVLGMGPNADPTQHLSFVASDQGALPFVVEEGVDVR